MLKYELINWLWQDADCSECYCVWCGRSSDLVSCKSCKTLFCSTCVKRNIGEACLSEVQASRWQCCSCSPSLLKRLTSELEKAMGSGDMVVSSSESDSENSDADNNLKVGYDGIPYWIDREIISVILIFLLVLLHDLRAFICRYMSLFFLHSDFIIVAHDGQVNWTFYDSFLHGVKITPLDMLFSEAS